jgi:hypothetical protein
LTQGEVTFNYIDWIKHCQLVELATILCLLDFVDLDPCNQNRFADDVIDGHHPKTILRLRETREYKEGQRDYQYGSSHVKQTHSSETG